MTTISLVVAVASVSAMAAETTGIPNADWFPKAPPLPKPTGEVIRAATVDELFQAAHDVQPGGTILVAEGHYMMPRYFELRTDDVTLRGESGDRDTVILDGAQSRHGELVGITACSGVTIADLTIQNIKWNGFKLNSNKNVQRVTIYNCVIHNIWQRGIKGVAVPEENREQVRPKDCRVQYCLFYNDHAKRYEDDPADRPDNFGGNYIGGMDIMYATNWTISDNVFIGIQGRTRSARGAIFLWHDSRDCVVERNLIIDCDSGICLGNSHRTFEGQIHAVRCTVRNNFVTRAPEQGILADYTQDCAIVHNTIHHPGNRLKRLIRLVHDNDGLAVANNLLSGPPMRQELIAGKMRVFGNVTQVMSDSFVDAEKGDLHMQGKVDGVANAGERVSGANDDIDGHVRDEQPDIGAHELTPRSRRGSAQVEGKRPKHFRQPVIFQTAFDPEPTEKQCPGEFEIVDKGSPPDSHGRVAGAVPHHGGPRKWIRLQIVPPRPVGAHTKLRFRYHLTGASKMTVQIFDLTDMDNRHIRLEDLPQNEWQTLDLDFTRDAKRNDGTETPFAAGHVVDDIFFFVEPQGDADVNLLVDEVELYDAAG